MSEGWVYASDNLTSVKKLNSILNSYHEARDTVVNCHSQMRKTNLMTQYQNAIKYRNKYMKSEVVSCSTSKKN